MVSLARAANTTHPIPLTLDVLSPIYFQDSDISDQKEEHYLSKSFLLPSRPTSRLGYNCAVMEEAPRPQSVPTPGAAILVSSPIPTDTFSCLSQIDTASKVSENSTSEADSGDFTMDIATLAMPIDCRNSRTSVPNPQFNGARRSPFDDETDNFNKLESDCSYEDTELEEDISPPPQICPVPVRKSISYLCFPFVTTPSPKRTPPPPPTPTSARPKYSILPSPLSSTHPLRPHPPQLTHARHNYHQHGHSYHALNHFKWFWSIRQNEWDSYSGQILAGHFPSMPNHSTPRTIGSSSDIPPRPVSTLHITPKSTPLSPASRCQLPPMTIHPRRGDLSSLRDPYCVDIDRFFVGLPTWTIGKTLWIFDVHMASAMRMRAQTAELDDISLSRQTDTDSECESAGTFDSLSDDSDITLVDDEEILSTLGSYEMDQDSVLSSSPLHSSSTSSSSSLSSSISVAPVLKPIASLLWIQETYLDQISTDSAQKEKSLKLPARPSPFWATNWYRRWEIIMELSHRDHTQLPPPRTVPMPLVNSQSPSSSKFYLADLDTEGDEAWNEIVEVSGEDCVEKDVLVVCPPLTRLSRQRQVTV